MSGRGRWTRHLALIACVASTVLLVFALGALTSAELVTSAGEWFLSVNLAPARLRERYLSVSKTSMAVQQAAGPVLVTTTLTGWGRLGWLALASLLAAGTLASRRLATRETARRLSPTATTPFPQMPAADRRLRHAGLRRHPRPQHRRARPLPHHPRRQQGPPQQAPLRDARIAARLHARGAPPAPPGPEACRVWGALSRPPISTAGHFWAPHYGQLGSSREPTLNSAGGTPSVWFTLSIFRSTLL